jgi:hypothetical protein
MSVLIHLPLAWWAEALWAVPAVGAAACLFAYLVGRSLLPSRPPPKKDPLAEDEDGFLKGVTRDRRAAERRRGNAVEVLISDGSDQDCLHGFVLDRSTGGLKLLVETSLPVGANLKVRAWRARTATPWVDIIVRSCRPDGALHEVGCQFAHTPALALLMQFG